MGCRDYCFTSFKETIEPDTEFITYICWGCESCPSTGRTHLQGFVCFNRTCRMPKAKKWLGDEQVHLEKRHGTREQARDYCKKDGGDFYERGTLEVLTTKEIFKLPLSRIKEEYPIFYCRYHRGLEKLAVSKPIANWRTVDVTAIWGESGSGKTRKVMEMENVYKIDPPYKWFDGYEGESILLIDDYETGAIPRGFFLNLIDGYRLRLETKGSHTWALWDKVYITTNDNPTHWDVAVVRRINHIEKLVCDK